MELLAFESLADFVFIVFQMKGDPVRLGVAPKKDKSGLAGDLDSTIESMKRVPWTALSELKGDRDIIKKIDEAEALLKSLRKALEP